MSASSPSPATAIHTAFDKYTLEAGIRNAKVACALVFVLMPIGALMDFFVYEVQAPFFLVLRLMSSALAALVWIGLRQPGLSERQTRLLCMGWYVVPSFFICWMINATEGFNSTYYAGLNLVILAVSSVIQATLWESLRAVTIIILMYLSACLLHSTTLVWSSVANNSFFIFCTAAIVITGNYFYNRLRFREFALRYELNENRRQLEDSNRKLLQLDELKNRFFANVSHELRTPLTLLLAPLEKLQQRFQATVDDATRALLATMHANGMRLLKLINDLLDLVRLESGIMQVKREAVDVGQFVRGLLSAAQQMADDRRITLQATVSHDLGPVMVDRDKLEKIVLNLLFNALKFTPSGGRVEIRTVRQEEQLLIAVSDSGIGIAAKDLPHIFDRFWQADTSSRRKYQGVGIGLALVKELTEAQDGRVSVQSQEGQGTTFTVTLPYLAPDDVPAAATAEGTDAAASPSASAADADPTTAHQEWLANLYRRAELFPAQATARPNLAVAAPSPDRSLPTVLIADDEPDMLRFLVSQLQERYQVVEAVDGQQAVDQAAQVQPDIILLDMMMPEKDGLQACREIRQSRVAQSAPIILLTARADEETKYAALAAGASDFLAKPFSTTELHVRVKNLVESYQYQRKLAEQNLRLETTIEQLKETETQLVQTEKLVSLGRMSAGIIHEINNPLNFATTGLYALRSKARHLTPDQRSDYEEMLKDVEDGIKRVKTIVSDLRSFSHHENTHSSELDVAQVVAEALRFLSHEWRDKVAIEQHLPDGLTLTANRNKLTQVLVNLLQNSLDALKTKAFDGERPTIRIIGEQQDGQVLLRVHDNGQGIDPEDVNKIFDPFFTTKDVGEGMGLGLSICYRILREYDGQITVKSEPGKFCEFRLAFPVKAASAAA